MQRALGPLMALILLMAVVLLLASALVRPTLVAPQEHAARVEQVDSSAYPQIDVYVTVEDVAGRPRRNLEREDFRLREEGVPVDLSGFGGAGAEPVTSLLVIDQSLSMAEAGKIEGAREAAAAFVELMRPGDQAGVLVFNEEADLRQDFSDNHGELARTIARIRPTGGTALYDAVVAGVELLQAVPGRRLLLVLSDGQDCRVAGDGCPDEYGSQQTLDEAIAYAQAAGQPVVVVGLGNPSGVDEAGIDEEALGRIAAESGGQYFYTPQANELAGLYTEVAGAVQQEYRLSYVSPRPFYDGTRRVIEVQVGAALATSGYTERHLINVVAAPLVGLVLLLPLVGLLVLPGIVSARQRKPATNAIPEPQPALGEKTSGSIGAHSCSFCGTTMRTGAHFCPSCGRRVSLVEAMRDEN